MSAHAPAGNPTPLRALLATPLVHNDSPLADQARRAQSEGADIIELRADCIDDPAAVEALLRSPDRPTCILTLRSAAEGGRFDGSDAERIALIERLGLLSPGFIDIEMDTWKRSANLRQKLGLVCDTGGPQPLHALDRPRNRLILSRHDWTGEQCDKPGRMLDELLAEAGVVTKAAFTARDASDALSVLTALHDRRALGREIIAIAMGEAGIASRVLAGKFGGFLSFAALDEAGASAPGQLTLREMRHLYRWNSIRASTRVYGIVGWPVSHSRSPHVHNAAFAAAGIGAVYVPFPVSPDAAGFDHFADFVGAHPELDIDGLSVTIPHKVHALRWLLDRGHEVSDIAKRAGAVNTLTRSRDGRWHGDNTDGAGALAVLHCSTAVPESLRGERAAVLGAGGAARGVAAALQADGARVTIFNRTRASADALASALGCESRDWEERGQCDARIIVNCTSVGMGAAVGESPLPAGALRPGMAVLDTVYAPRRTRLLQDAAAAGATAIEGSEMFLEQAALQFERWVGSPAPRRAMRQAFEDSWT
ncbi:MAG: shikimate dehydrogenase [Phycisphaerales bacterium]|nr:shikimate dehydrogenase [Phycisphaerales bacterium]